jgi:hypothetical protein
MVIQQETSACRWPVEPLTVNPKSVRVQLKAMNPAGRVRCDMPTYNKVRQ